MKKQLPLRITLKETFSFENFVAGENREAFERLQALARGEASGALFLWGAPGTGKTHLLQAACRLAGERRADCAYVPLDLAARLPVGLLEDREQADLVCLDDVQAIAGRADWEAAVFTLYERVRARHGVFVAAADVTPAGLPIAMPDLRTRLGAGLVYQLRPLADGDKLAALRERARQRGLDLPEDVGRYVLERYPRDTHALFTLLDRLDETSLAAQRRITIPLVRSLRDAEE